MVCSPITTDCTPVSHPTNTVTLDPVWSPHGTSLAYVQGPARQSIGFLQPTVASWYNAHQLYLFDPDTGSVHLNSQAKGVTVPLWSGDGDSLLFVSNNGLWLNPAPDRPPVEIAYPLFTPGLWPTFYGQVSFSAQFSWSSTTTTSLKPGTPSANAR
jgi:dipeptidyl aminopeptidase/acylaminoacyl peptidase